MAPEGRNRAAVLAALLALLVAVVMYQWWSRPASVGAPASNGRGTGRSSPRSATSTPDAPVVHLPALEDERPKPLGGARNLFRFKPKTAPPAPAPIPTAPAPPPPPTFGPTTPPIALRFIGIIDRGSGKPKIAALVDGSGHPINCLEGGDCDGRYHIWRVGAESVDISYLDGTGRRTIRLGGG